MPLPGPSKWPVLVWHGCKGRNTVCMYLLCEQLRTFVCLHERHGSVSGAKKTTRDGNRCALETGDEFATSHPGSGNVVALNDVSNDEINASSSAAAAATAAVQSDSPLERQVAAICDLMATKLQSDAELRHQVDKTDQLRQKWMTAAAVVDHICFVTLAVVFIAGSSMYLLL